MKNFKKLHLFFSQYWLFAVFFASQSAECRCRRNQNGLCRSSIFLGESIMLSVEWLRLFFSLARNRNVACQGSNLLFWCSGGNDKHYFYSSSSQRTYDLVIPGENKIYRIQKQVQGSQQEYGKTTARTGALPPSLQIRTILRPFILKPRNHGVKFTVMSGMIKEIYWPGRERLWAQLQGTFICSRFPQSIIILF